MFVDFDDSEMMQILINNLENYQLDTKSRRRHWASFDVDICENPKIFHLSIRDIFVYESLIRFACKYKVNPISISFGLLRHRIGQRRIKKRDLIDSTLSIAKSQLIEFIGDSVKLLETKNAYNRTGQNRTEHKNVCIGEVARQKKINNANQATHDKIEQLYQRILAKKGLMVSIPFGILHSGKAREALEISLGHLPNISDWEKLFTQVAETPNLIGTGSLGFCASIIWLVNYDNICKVRAGTFNSIPTQKTKNSGPKTFAQQNQNMLENMLKPEELENGKQTIYRENTVIDRKTKKNKK